MKLRAAILALALAACGQTGEQAKSADAEPLDPFAMSVEVGRYGVMLSQIQNINSETPDATEQDVTAPADLARRLRETVWRYNLTRSELCARGLHTQVSCGPTFQPVWMGEPTDSAPSLEELQTRNAAVGDEVMRFWNAVCEAARTAETNEEARAYVCAIE